MERKIGERFNCDGVTLEVVEQRGCEGCYFTHPNCALFWETRHACGGFRTDDKSVVFKRVEQHLNKTK